MARFLVSEGIDARPYSGDTDPVDRALDRAPAVLMRGHEDEDIQDYFIRTAFPTRQQAEEVIGILRDAGAPVTVGEILSQVNVSKGRVEAMLKVLEVDGAVARDRGKWWRTPEEWSYDQERVSSVTAARRAEQQAMRDYAATDKCLMEFLRLQLDDPEAAPCGRCANCTGEQPSVEVDREMVGRALAHLRGSDLLIEPRKMWASGVAGLKGRIPVELLSETGRALCAYGDGAWGPSVRRAIKEGSAFPPELVEASASLIRARWKPDPAPEWMTCVPSAERPEQVPAFAEALAAKLGLPFALVVGLARAHRPQSEMENSAQQLRNIHGAFVVAGALPSGPVLLVDDAVDSGWTITVAGAALREAGSGSVHPFALAKTGSA